MRVVVGSDLRLRESLHGTCAPLTENIEYGLLSKYSVQDFIMHLKYIQRLKINGFWVTGEISGKTQKLLDALDIHIT